MNGKLLRFGLEKYKNFVQNSVVLFETF